MIETECDADYGDHDGDSHNGHDDENDGADRVLDFK